MNSIGVFDLSGASLDKRYEYCEIDYTVVSASPPTLIGKVSRLSKNSFRFYIKGRKRFLYKGKATTLDTAVQRCIAFHRKEIRCL